MSGPKYANNPWGPWEVGGNVAPSGQAFVGVGLNGEVVGNSPDSMRFASPGYMMASLRNLRLSSQQWLAMGAWPAMELLRARLPDGVRTYGVGTYFRLISDWARANPTWAPFVQTTFRR